MATYKKILLSVLIIILLGGGYVCAYYFYHKYSELSKNPNTQTQEKALAILAQVNKLVVVPETEIPNISIITDKNALTGQTFFENAQNGDVLLVYPKALEAVLYRESSGQIVAVSSLVNQNTTTINDNTSDQLSKEASSSVEMATTTRSSQRSSKKI